MTDLEIQARVAKPLDLVVKSNHEDLRDKKPPIRTHDYERKAIGDTVWIKRVGTVYLVPNSKKYCKNCGQLIRWAKSKYGKWIPLRHGKLYRHLCK